MKNSIVVFVLLIMLVGCEKDIHITQPTILIKNGSLEAFDTIKITCTEYAEIDNERQYPNCIRWSILDEYQHIVYSVFEDSSAISWIPDSAGYFVISATIDYDNNKSITAFKEAIVHESPISLQKKLIGRWCGNAHSLDNVVKWQLDVTFNEAGHYVGRQYNGYSSGMIHYDTGPFDMSYYFISDSIVLPPSADVPCTRFIIYDVKDNMGFGRLSISREYENDGTYSYECSETYDIKDLVFSEGNNRLKFSLQFINAEGMARNFDLIKAE